jgi:pantetheine-phosphate adenylyltransferase
MSKERKAIYPGSFDPPTKGHELVMGKVSERYDYGFVAIGINPEKAGRFTIPERKEMLQEIIELNGFKNLEVDAYSGIFAVDYAEIKGATTIVRGTRNGRDFDYESEINFVNKSINPKIETISGFPDQEFLQVSSSMVMGLVGFEGWEQEVVKMVPVPVFSRIEKMQKEEDRLFLQKKWEELCKRLEARYDTEKVFRELIKDYSEPHRKYHGISHLKTCLNEFEQIRDMADDKNVLETAIWFHDIVNKPGDSESSDSSDEEKSAQWAYSTISHTMGLGNEFAEKVASLILVTKHSKPAKSKDEAFLMDIDLVSFGRSERIFNIYRDNVRAEYASVSPEIFEKKSAEILSSFVPPNRDSIYQSDFFKNRYETQARKNLQREIEQLSI